MRKITLFIASLFITIGAMAQITSAGSITSYKCYHITSKDTNRGAFYADPDGSYLSHCGASQSYVDSYSYFNADITAAATNPTQQFAFIKFQDKYYLYSVSLKKFAKKDGDYIKLVDNETPDFFTIGDEGTADNIHYFTINANGTNKLNISGGSGRQWGVYANYNTADDGNRLKITVAGDFNPAEAYDILSRFFPCFMQNWSTTTIWGNDLTNEEKPSGLPTTADNKTVQSVKKAETPIHISENTNVTVGFRYTSGGHALNIIGVDIINSNNEVVKFQYDAKHAGGDYAEEIFTLNNVEAGDYTLRYFVAYLGSEDGDPNKSNGGILVSNALLKKPEVGKYYRLKNCACNMYATSTVNTEGAHKDKLKMSDNGDVAESIWYFAEGNKFLAYSAGRYMDAMTTNNWNLDDAGHSASFGKTNIIGAFQIQPSEDRALYGDADRVDAAGISNYNANYSWIIEEVTQLPVSITDAQFATFYAPVNVQLPEDVTAYIITGKKDGNWLNMTEVTGGILPANEGVILYSENAVNCTLSVTTVSATIDAADNKLKGTVAKTLLSKEENKAYYVLAKQDVTDDEVENPEVCFYNAINGEDTTKFYNAGHKAYLVLSQTTSNQSNALRFDFGGTTAVEEVEAESENADVIYDLQGRRVNEITEAGIYIVNGNKVLVK